VNKPKDITRIESTDSKKVPEKVTYVDKRVSAKEKAEAKNLVTTFPNLVIKELIAFEILVIVLCVISLLFNAPLEWIANPGHTPSPAKAPWYFVGLQELLCYFPPVVAGVILPVLAIIALIVIPYFKINVEREPLWEYITHKKAVVFTAIIVLLTLLLLYYKAYPILFPTLGMTIFMIITRYIKGIRRFSKWIKARPLSWWIMTWFVIIVVILTTIGTLFRGPEWNWTWPWEGIY